MKVTLGTKKTERHESSHTKIVKYAMENVRIEDVVYLLSTMIRYRFTNVSQSSIGLDHGCLTRHKRVLMDHGLCQYFNDPNLPVFRSPETPSPRTQLNRYWTMLMLSASRKNHWCQRPGATGDSRALCQLTSKTSRNPMQILLDLLRTRWYSIPREDRTCLAHWIAADAYWQRCWR